MAKTYKVLGQSAPGATTLTTMYTVPAATSAVCSSITVCNRGAWATFRIAIRPLGVPIADQHYIAYDCPLDQNDTKTFTIGVTLAATDKVDVYNNNATISFSLFGCEIT